MFQNGVTGQNGQIALEHVARVRFSGPELVQLIKAVKDKATNKKSVIYKAVVSL